MAERTGRKIEALWDCPSCNTKGIRSRFKECPNCGSVYEGGYYLPKDIEGHVLSNEDKKLFTGVPDWKCDFCGRMNKSDLSTCKGCGSAKSSKNHFDYNAEVLEKQRQKIQAREHVLSQDTQSVKEEQKRETGSMSSEEKRKMWYDDLNYDDDSEGRFKFLHKSGEGIRPFSGFASFIPAILAVLGTVGVVALFIWLLIPKPDTLHIQSLEWERNISIQIEKTFHESGWTMPAGARLQYSNWEFKEYVQVIDHYETVTKTDYKTEQTGWDISYIDNGDGTFDEVKTPKYESVPYTYTEQEPVYRDEPVYATKYYYDIDRYVWNRNVPTSGNGHTEEWGTYELEVKERESGRSEKYSIKAVNKKDEVKDYDVDYDVWQTLDAGDVIDVKVDITGHISLIE